MSKNKGLRQDYSYGLIPFFWSNKGQPRYFIGRSCDADGRVGFWKFPKGHKEEEESNLQAACRETAEEIGVSIKESDVIAEQSLKERYQFTRGLENKRGSGTVQKENTYWLAEVSEDTDIKLNDEFSEYRWVTSEEAAELLPENSRVFLAQAHAFLSQLKS